MKSAGGHDLGCWLRLFLEAGPPPVIGDPLPAPWRWAYLGGFLI